MWLCGSCLKNSRREQSEGDLPYSVALRTDSNILGKECMQFGFFCKKKAMKQYSNTRVKEGASMRMELQSEVMTDEISVVRYQGEKSSPPKVVLPNLIRMKDGNPNGLDRIMEEKPKISKQLG